MDSNTTAHMATNHLFTTISKYIRLIITITKYSYMAALEYRFQFVVRIFRHITEALIAILIINTFFYSTNTIGNWDPNSMLLVYGVFGLAVATTFFFLADTPFSLPDKIRSGDYDFILTKPIDTHFYTFGHRIHTENVWRLIIKSAIIFYASVQLHLSPSIFHLTLFVFTFFSSLIIYRSIVTTIATLSFWTLSKELSELTFSVLETTKYPLDIFSKNITLLFTFIPLIFISTIPAKALLGQATFLSYLSFPVALLSLYVSRQFFHFAIKSYSSASS